MKIVTVQTCPLLGQRCLLNFNKMGFVFKMRRRGKFAYYLTRRGRRESIIVYGACVCYHLSLLVHSQYRDFWKNCSNVQPSLLHPFQSCSCSGGCLTSSEPCTVVILLQMLRIRMWYFLHASCCTVELRVPKGHLTFGEIQLLMRCYIPRFQIPFAFSYRKMYFPILFNTPPPKTTVTYSFHDGAYIIFLS
jgi:hypothetical protein